MLDYFAEQLKESPPQSIEDLSPNLILAMCNGIDADNAPNACAYVSFDSIVNGELKNRTYSLDKGVFSIIASEAATVVVVDFPMDCYENTQNITKQCSDWLSGELQDEMLTFGIAPMMLDLKAIFLFQDLLFQTSWEIYENNLAVMIRMIFVFDNAATQLIVSEASNIEDIQNEVEEQLRLEEEQLDLEIEALMKEEKELTSKANNPFETALHQIVSPEAVLEDDNNAEEDKQEG